MNKAALFSFLRVLSVALASAVLPFLTSDDGDEVPTRAILIALASAFLLTVINYFRPGEPRFGPHAHSTHGPHGDQGAGEARFIGLVILGVLIALLLFAVLTRSL